jgi:hypothetical protein
MNPMKKTRFNSGKDEIEKRLSAVCVSGFSINTCASQEMAIRKPSSCSALGLHTKITSGFSFKTSSVLHKTWQ